eukprot:CAMPEP_0202690280 /NCGR_PEP_ID=MMETSP1385-20130828/5304_1 /ASSEMBLY_ACC=CAM_ASM_000861 /TAXON_ID=933848 /ORGANISM="Elphidium margaritaceum" /LENGTH=857 /DNA_ID=CAMNT_0049345517 /DNA_START=231 /DNA_END=2804 /DNA_ORIENTATION=+
MNAAAAVASSYASASPPHAHHSSHSHNHAHTHAHSLPGHHPPPPQHKFNQHHYELPLPSLSSSPEVRNGKYASASGMKSHNGGGGGVYHVSSSHNGDPHPLAHANAHAKNIYKSGSVKMTTGHRSHSQNAKHSNNSNNHHHAHNNNNNSQVRATSYPIQPHSLSTSHSQAPAAHRSVPLHMNGHANNNNHKHHHNDAHNHASYYVNHTHTQNPNHVAMQLSSPEVPAPLASDSPLITIHRHHHQQHPLQQQQQPQQHQHNSNTATASDADIVDLSDHNGHHAVSDDVQVQLQQHQQQQQYDHDGHVISLSPLQIVEDTPSKHQHPLQQQPQPQSKHSSHAHRHQHRHHHGHRHHRNKSQNEDSEEDDDVDSHDHDHSSSSASSASSSDAEFEHAYPVKVIAFDLDKTMVRTISLHTDEQPQPEQHPGGYFMFFDDDTKEYHHVYKRPHLTALLDFLYSAIVRENKCKMMLCTHGTQKYAQTILERCDADKLFPLMLPRRDWCRRKFEDDYKPRRFKTLEKMAKSVNETVDDLIMIDDDPGVYSKGDRCNGSLVHIKPFDDPYEQRDDTELSKLITLLSAVLKYGKNYYNKLFANAIRYTGLVRTRMTAHEMNQHSILRAELLKRLVFDCALSLNAQEKLGTIFLFDRYCARQPVDWRLLQSNKHSVHQYVVLLFVCLFIARQYLYTDSKRPKQFRRDPYSAEIWLVHVDLYEQMLKRYKIVNGGGGQASQQQHHAHAHMHDHQCKELIPMPTDVNGVLMTSSPAPMDASMLGSGGYQTQTHHRRKRKHKNREKHMYFSQLHSIQNQILDVIEYPKLLHGLFHRPEAGYDSTLFVRYEKYVESLFHHIQQTQLHKKHE